ncbi:hypothetical protein ABK040_005961 [Willaertia magna]
MSSSSSGSPNCVKEGDTIVIRVNSGNALLLQFIKPDTVVKVAKNKSFIGSQLIGQPYYSYYELISNDKDKTSSIKRMNYNPDAEEEQQEENEETIVTPSTNTPSTNNEDVRERDNRMLIDNNKSQQLTQDEIINLKEKGIGGKEIIEKLIEGSKSFNVRTQFSQQKYLKKKKKKYLTYFKISEPTTQEICEFYFNKNPEKTSYLRIDGLSQLLTLGGVYPNKKIMVLETCLGLVVASVFERIQTHGMILRVAPDEMITKHAHCVTYFNTPKENFKIIKDIPFSKLSKEEHQVDCLLVASNQYLPLSVLNNLFPYLKDSGTFAFYSSYREPLEHCHNKLKEEKLGIMVQLTETWMREYQVLPRRTHPMMTTSSTSGKSFLLVDVRVGLEALAVESKIFSTSEIGVFEVTFLFTKFLGVASASKPVTLSLSELMPVSVSLSSLFSVVSSLLTVLLKRLTSLIVFGVARIRLSCPTGVANNAGFILEGLPSDLDEVKIADWLTGLEIADQGIHLIFDDEYQFTGEAFVEFLTEESVTKALEKILLY